MALCKRLIARLDIKGSRLIKGIRFEGLRVLGDPCDAAKRYASAGADELLYIDAVASLYGRNGLADLLRRTSREVFIPVTAGGGVRSVSDAAALLAAGADKIAVNTAALQRPELITELAEAFGSQCVVVSIQARRTASGCWEAMAEAGRERSGRDVMAWIEYVQQLGAGELLLTSVDQDGTCAGPDLPLQHSAASIARVPLVLCGGFAEAKQILVALQQPAVSAVSIGSALHRDRLELNALKQQLAELPPQLPIRPASAALQYSLAQRSQSLAGQKVGVIDYGMGNQQSLINAFEHLGASVLLSADKEKLQACNLITLPGVGAFPHGMAELEKRGLDQWLRFWISTGGSLLGICLGMQMLFESSEEFSQTPGLGLFKGNVVRLPCCDEQGNPLVLPHLGWNRLLPAFAPQNTQMNNLPYQYFVHSYVATNVDPAAVLYHCRYGHQTFVAGVRHKSVVGLQFHPERSGGEGLDLLALISKELLV